LEFEGMMQLGQYSALERQREKQRSRDQDDCDLLSGAASVSELVQRNGFFSGLAVSRGRIARRGSLSL
jgi:hypothetical protein